MKHSDALRRFGSLFRRQAPTAVTPNSEPSLQLSGPTLLDQEPDLAREFDRRARDFSGWAAGGHPND